MGDRMKCCGEKIKKDWACCPICGKGFPMVVEAVVTEFLWETPPVVEFGDRELYSDTHKMLISCKHGTVSMPTLFKPGRKRITIEDI